MVDKKYRKKRVLSTNNLRDIFFHRVRLLKCDQGVAGIVPSQYYSFSQIDRW